MRRTASYIFAEEIGPANSLETRAITMRKSTSFTTLTDLALAAHTSPSPVKLRSHVVITLTAAGSRRTSRRPPLAPRLRHTDEPLDALDAMEPLELAPALLGSALFDASDLSLAPPRAPKLRPIAADLDARVEPLVLAMACAPLELTKASAVGAMRPPRRGLHASSPLGAGHSKHRGGGAAPMIGSSILAGAHSVAEQFRDAEPLS